MSEKFISWNVNGLRSINSKGVFKEFIDKEEPDALCLQETKLQEGQIDLQLEGYDMYWNYADKKGYSGTAIFIKKDFLVKNALYGMGIDEHDHEGRVISLELDDYFLVTCYTPNSKHELLRLDYRCKWEDDFRKYLKTLEKTKPVILCGDLNVAHNEIDLKNPETNHENPGFSDAEREKFSLLLEEGFVDSFRFLYPEKKDAYSWWSYRMRARERNIGWRIDYFVLSKSLSPRLKDAVIYNEILGSDHCPVGILLK